MSIFRSAVSIGLVFHWATACMAATPTVYNIRDYGAVIALKPDFAEAYNNRAIARARTGRREEAARDWAKAIALRPDYAEAYYNRALLYFDMKEYTRSLADVKKFQKFGGRPDPAFVKSLTEAVNRAK